MGDLRLVRVTYICGVDETHVTKSSAGSKGGPWANTLTNPDLTWSGIQVFKRFGRPIKDVFFSLSPNLMFNTKSKIKEKMKVMGSWCAYLPFNVRFWGFEELFAVVTNFAVYKKGIMDKVLFIQTILFTSPCFHIMLQNSIWLGIHQSKV